MGLSKRQKARRLAEIEADRRWQENQRLNPPPPSPPWTPAQLAEMERVHSILNELIHIPRTLPDMELISELLRLYYVFAGTSRRMASLRADVAHYRELTQQAAKEKLWKKMYGEIYGISAELETLRASKPRGGPKPQ